MSLHGPSQFPRNVFGGHKKHAYASHQKRGYGTPRATSDDTCVGLCTRACRRFNVPRYWAVKGGAPVETAETEPS